MITVSYNAADCALTVKGHAGAGEYGHDIVCAGMSALWYALRTAAEAREGTAVQEAPGDSSITMMRSHDARIIMDTIVGGIGCLAQEYPEHIKIIRIGG